MTTFRILDQRPVYLDLAGNIASGGSLKFYSTGTTTPKDVYADPAKSVNNGSTVTLGTDGRPTVDVWGEGSYRVRLYDANGTLVSEADDVEIPGGTGTTIPALVSGQFLTSDGAVMSWADVRQVPDPTGSANKVLGTDGTVLVWRALSNVPLPADGVAQTPASFTIGKLMVQTGSATCTASGSHTASVSVTFASAMSSCMGVHVTPTIAGVSSSGYNAVPAVQAKSGSGFTVQFDINAAVGSSVNITNNITFDYVAFGLIP